MALFRPYERTSKDERQRPSTVTEPKPAKTHRQSEASVVEEPAQNITVRRGEKKGPTPTRREAEAARMERLHPNLSPKEQRKADRQARYEAQALAWDKVERSPERTLLRDFVDTRWTVAEFMMPAMILIMAVMLATMTNPLLSSYVALSLWVLMFFAIINTWVMWRSFKKLLAERVPGASTKGLLMYMINRSMMIRRFRRPAPRINRGDPI